MVDYDDFRPISLLQRRCHIRRVAIDDGRGGNGAERTSNEHEARYCGDGYHGAAGGGGGGLNGALLQEKAITADRQY